MLQLKNHTPFEAAISLFPDENAIDTLYVVVKATFTLEQNPQLSEEQIPPVLEDVYWGDPVESSLKYASEMHIGKPGTDIIVNGHAYAPRGVPVAQLDCGIKVGNYSKQLRVFGDRYWHGTKITAPEPFVKMPLLYENAYGGAYWEFIDNKQGGYYKNKILHTINPVGRGYRGGQGTEPINADKLPNLEDPRQLIKLPGDKSPPAAFAMLSPTWKPRVNYVGTYDEAWQKKQAPYLPKDFNSKFFNMASQGLVANGFLQGNEPVLLVNLTPESHVKFQIPMCDVKVDIKIEGSSEKPLLNLETLFFEPDENQFMLTWRAKLNCDKKALKISEVHITSGFDKIEKTEEAAA